MATLNPSHYMTPLPQFQAGPWAGMLHGERDNMMQAAFRNQLLDAELERERLAIATQRDRSAMEQEEQDAPVRRREREARSALAEEQLRELQDPALRQAKIDKAVAESQRANTERAENRAKERAQFLADAAAMTEGDDAVNIVDQSRYLRDIQQPAAQLGIQLPEVYTPQVRERLRQAAKAARNALPQVKAMDEKNQAIQEKMESQETLRRERERLNNEAVATRMRELQEGRATDRRELQELIGRQNETIQTLKTAGTLERQKMANQGAATAAQIRATRPAGTAAGTKMSSDQAVQAILSQEGPLSPPQVQQLKTALSTQYFKAMKDQKSIMDVMLEAQANNPKIPEAKRKEAQAQLEKLNSQRAVEANRMAQEKVDEALKARGQSPLVDSQPQEVKSKKFEGFSATTR